MRYHDVLADFFAGNATLRRSAAALLRVDDHYPPLAPLAVSPAFAVAGGDPRAPTFVLNQAALALLLAATYALGKRYSSEDAGLLAAMAVTAFPIVSSQSRMFMLDLPDAAMTAVALLALARAERFRGTGRSLLFGAALGAGLLTKWTIVFFLAAPFAFEMVGMVREQDRGKRLRNALWALLAAAAIALPWYAAHVWNLLRDSTKFAYDVGVREGDPPVLSVKALLFYASSLPAAMLLPWLLLFAAGVVAAARDRFRRSPALFLSIAFGWLILTSIRNKDSRYVIPMLPAIAVVGAGALEAVRVRFPAKAGAVTAIAAISLWVAWRRDPPAREAWPMREAVRFLEREPVARPRLRVVPDLPSFERHGFEYYAETERFPLDVGTWFRFPAFTDFVLTKTGEQGERPEPARIMRGVEDPRGDFPLLFRPVWRRPLPDGSVATLHARAVTPVPEDAPKVVRALETAAADLVSRFYRHAEGVEIEVEPFSEIETRRGRFRRVEIRIADAAMGGKRPGSPSLSLKKLRFTALDVVINPYRLLREGEIELLSLREAVPAAEIREDDASRFLAGLVPGGDAIVRFSRGAISVHASPRRSPGVSLDLEPRIVAGENIGFEIKRFSVGGVPLPAPFAQALIAGNNPILKPMPCRVRLDRLTADGGRLALNEEAQ